MTHTLTHPQAIIAVQAAQFRYGRNIGHYASWRFAEKQGCPQALYRLACQLEVMKRAGL